MSMFKVAAHTGADNQGWIGYNEETKEITVCLQDEVLDMFKLALGKIWEATTVYIDWSRPVE